MTDPKNLGLCLFGEYIARLVDQGESESVDTISEKALNKELVKYLIDKYKIDISNTTYDINAFEEFFFDNLLESRKSGIFNNGLLSVISTILDVCERQC